MLVNTVRQNMESNGFSRVKADKYWNHGMNLLQVDHEFIRMQNSYRPKTSYNPLINNKNKHSQRLKWLLIKTITATINQPIQITLLIFRKIRHQVPTTTFNLGHINLGGILMAYVFNIHSYTFGQDDVSLLFKCF